MIKKEHFRPKLLSGNAILIIFCMQYVHFMVLITHV